MNNEIIGNSPESRKGPKVPKVPKILSNATHISSEIENLQIQIDDLKIRIEELEKYKPVLYSSLCTPDYSYNGQFVYLKNYVYIHPDLVKECEINLNYEKDYTRNKIAYEDYIKRKKNDNSFLSQP